MDDALAEAARKKVKDIYYLLFNDGGDYHDFANAAVTRYVDEAGYREMLLDTLPFLQSAQRIYRAAGFREIERYNDSPMDDATYMKLEL